jgi:hypothetical protein
MQISHLKISKAITKDSMLKHLFLQKMKKLRDCKTKKMQRARKKRRRKRKRKPKVKRRREMTERKRSKSQS